MCRGVPGELRNGLGVVKNLQAGVCQIMPYNRPQLVAMSTHDRVQGATQADAGGDLVAIFKSVADIRK